MQGLIGKAIDHLVADKGHRGHNAPPDYKFRVFTSVAVTAGKSKIKRELCRRSAIEPVICYLKSEHRMGRNYLWHRQGDTISTVLAAIGYNFRHLLRWLQLLSCKIFVPAPPPTPARPKLKSGFFTDNLTEDRP